MNKCRPRLRYVPKINLNVKGTAKPGLGDDRQHTFSYDARGHEETPHVVKFSGGRTSGLLLFMLLDNGMLKPERGDVVVFNNTTAEHPETYKFVAQCKKLVEEKYKVPFFWVEFQTYEDARRGEWTRLPSYRMVHPYPYSKSEPYGYRSKGEAFEEMLSWSGYVPNQFQRTCTKNLKLETTKRFLQDWLSGQTGIARLGHYGESSRLKDDEMYARHKKHGGEVPKDIFLQKKAYVRSCPVFRPEQSFADYSSAAIVVPNGYSSHAHLGGNGFVEDGDAEYISFIGLRKDEMQRVARVRQRNLEDVESDDHAGEYIYMPLSSMGIEKKDVDAFWVRQKWGLQLSEDTSLSNCVYCFLKGAGGLQKVHAELSNGHSGVSKNGALAHSPSDIRWWMQMESRYGRNIMAEGRKIRNKKKINIIGFFGNSNNFSYQLLAKNGEGKADISPYLDTVLPCDCTD
ncbi:MAG: hypothetical protein OXH88_04435 [Gammaproteobacteria bacterium]|nr:hypothetical protein [Gammaproteobacteria bacterium]